MARVRVIGPDGRARVVDLDDAQVRALKSSSKPLPFVSSSGRILKEAVDSLEKGKADRGAYRRDK